MSTAAGLSELEQVAAALERGAPVDEVLDLVDEAIERATADGAAATLVGLGELLAGASLTRPDARGLAVAATRARAAAAALATPPPPTEARRAETPEPPSRPAAAPTSGWWRRAGAFVSDWVVLLSVMTPIPAESDAAFVFAVFVLPIAYFAGLHAYGHGRTVGKWIFGIAVRRADGGPVDLPHALGRAAVQCLLWITVIGGIVDSLVPLGDSRRRSVHDRAAGTVVVRVR